MTKQELLKKNEAILRERQKNKVEKPIDGDQKETEKESKRETESVEVVKEEPIPTKKKARKPAKREYMVVDYVGIEQEQSQDNSTTEDVSVDY